MTAVIASVYFYTPFTPLSYIIHPHFCSQLSHPRLISFTITFAPLLHPFLISSTLTFALLLHPFLISFTLISVHNFHIPFEYHSPSFLFTTFTLPSNIIHPHFCSQLSYPLLISFNLTFAPLLHPFLISLTLTFAPILHPFLISFTLTFAPLLHPFLKSNIIRPNFCSQLAKKICLNQFSCN